jgi:GNAT superfamily N-acetyltransferase
VSGGEVRFEPLAREALARALPDLARLRTVVFRDFPYLYDGSLDYEQGYLRTYADTPGSVIIGALAGDRLIGAATALPMRGEPAYVTEPLREAGYDLDRLFYFGESVLEKGWRGKGIGVRFFTEREAWARRSGDYTHAVFCAVIRPPDHPARPPDYQPLDRFWGRRGFSRIPGLVCHFEWLDVGDSGPTRKPMAYWIKPLR